MASTQVPPPMTPPKRSIKKRIGTTRERTGCLTCRQRRKKCDDNTYPICGHCRRLNIECVREPPRILLPSPNLPENQIVEISRIPTAVQISSFTSGKGQHDTRYLMKYYTSILSSLCTTNHENNSFLSVFLPMAMESSPLLSSLMAWSSAHLSCFNPSFRIPAVEKQSLAFAAVANSLSAPASSGSDSLRETELASCLVLCATEVSLGDTSRWYDHLVGARGIILPAQVKGPGGRVYTGTKAFMNSVDGAWLLRNFAYHDILGSVTTGDQPLIKGDYWMHDNVEVIGQLCTIVKKYPFTAPITYNILLNRGTDSYAGVASKVLVFISETSCLPSEISARKIFEEGVSESEDIEEDVWQQYRSLEARLLEWTCPEATQPGLVSMAYAYKSAATIHLYRKWREALLRPTQYDCLQRKPSTITTEINSKISLAVKDTLRYISEVAPTSLPECSFLFPLFMAGGNATDPRHIEVIRTRLKTLLEHRGFGNIKTAIEVLEELWRLKACEITNKDGLEVDWIDIIKSNGIKLILA